MISLAAFPRLTSTNHRVSSPEAVNYNCIAWAAGDTERWWEPGLFWPIPVAPNDYSPAALAAVFLALGFNLCVDGEPEPGFEKVALYENNLGWAHAARQLATGRWTSKLGKAEDIEHDRAKDVAGGIYGELRQYMKRAISSG